MKTVFYIFTSCFFCLSLFLVQPLVAANTSSIMPPEIHQIISPSTSIGLYDKFEISIDFSASFTNPYDYEQVHLSAIFTAPNGQTFQVDGFYMESFILNTNNGALNTSHEAGQFKIRLAPTQVGTWSYIIKVQDQEGIVASERLFFDCLNSDNQGFIKKTNSHYLSFSNGDQYIPIGENMAWQSNNVYRDYHKWLNALSDNQGNFIRLWHAHWGLGLEWKDGWRDFKGLRRYHQKNAAYQDWLFDFCAEKGIYVMLTLQHHGQVSTQVNPEWSGNPYNSVNGGMCHNVWDFFTDATALIHTKNRLRYIVARWGYAQSIMAWELFNEVDWMNNYEEKDFMVTTWHQEMATFLKTIDPYQHLVTTSFAEATTGIEMWDIPDIDLTQTHFYLDNPHLERALANGIQRSLLHYQKPTLTGEFGLGISTNINTLDPNGIHIHNALWGALFAGGAGTGMTWWWDSYIDTEDLYYHYAAIAKLSQNIPFLNKKMTPTKVKTVGAPGDLSIVPTTGWGTSGDSFITIHEGGSTSPEELDLSLYLYGNQWNTQYKSPPTFNVFYPKAATFTLQTASQSGARPELAIYIDEQLVLEIPARVNQTYTIPVPAGQHEIKVDNVGRDWITIAGYEFENIGTKIDAYVLRSMDQQTATGWVLNNDYNYQFLNKEGVPSAAVGGQLSSENWENGAYQVNWYNCLTGATIKTELIEISDQRLTLAIPDLYWDLAFKIQPAGNPVTVNNWSKESNLTLFPNPIKSGEVLQIKNVPPSPIQSISLLDAAGKLVHQFEKELFIPRNITAGFYWVKLLDQNGYMFTQPLVIQ